MNDMVERLARLLASWQGMQHLEIDGLKKEGFDWNARQILEVMREPTLAMGVAVWRDAYRVPPKGAWRAMIDAALADE